MSKRLFAFLIAIVMVVIIGVVIVVAKNWDRIDNQESNHGAHLRIDKSVIVDISSSNCIFAEIINEPEHEKNEYSLSNRDIVSAVFSEDNQRAIDFIGKLHVGSIVDISRYDTIKPQNTSLYITLEYIGINIYDDKGEEVVELF